MNQLIKKKLKSEKGMTLAETLIVVAIVIILAAVGFIAIMSYQRTMAQNERDAIAKELFITAQNHLTMSKSQNYPGCNVDFLKPEDEMTADDTAKMVKAAGMQEEGSDGVYYIMVHEGDVLDDATRDGHYMLEQMLPFGSIDDTVRSGGNYVIRYQPNIGKIMDVFYCSASGSPAKFNYTFAATDYSATGDGLLTLNNKGAKDRRKDYKDGKVLGWYGGEGLKSLGHKISIPNLKIHNSDTQNDVLFAEPRYGSLKDYADGDVSLRLIVEGKQSGAKKMFDVDKNGSGNDPSIFRAGDIVFDDITTQNMNFGKLFKEADKGAFIPGEDLKVRLIAFSSTLLANVAESDIKEVNSLFDKIADGINENSSSGDSTQYTLDGKVVTVESANDGIPDTAYIKSFRHLENLDSHVSNLDTNDTENKLGIRKAIQTEDLSWSGFIGSKQVYYSNMTGQYYDPANHTSTGQYKPVDPPAVAKGFIYNGRKHSITGVKVNREGNGGLFGTVSTGSKIKDIELKGFEITSTGSNAGALAGSLTGTVTNVIAEGSSSSVSGTNAGGLVGNLGSGSVIEYSAASVKVTGNQGAGGLVGTGSGTITGCYSGGHTKDGKYDERVSESGYDVTGVTAGGLIGNMSGGRVENSYSTCSATSSSDSGSVGGFAGRAGGTITNCYCTGLVGGADDGNKGPFIGENSLTGSADNMYYSVINEEQELVDDVAEPLDADTSTFKTYTSQTCLADVYDGYLKTKYPGSNGKATYVFKSVEGLSGSGTEFPKGYNTWSDFFINDHYGDWPSPELFAINTR